MYKRSNKEFVFDMFLACRNILDYTEGMDFDSFFNDKKTIDAVVRNIEILGEAVKNISKNFRDKYPEIEWKIIAKTRDKVIHFYFGLDVDILWKIACKDIRILFQKLKNIIEKEGWESDISL